MNAIKNSIDPDPERALEQVGTLGHDLVRPECVLATATGDFYTADWRGGVAHLRADGTQTLYAGVAPDGITLKPNGITLLRNGDFLVTHLGNEEGGVYRLERSGQVSPWLMSVDGLDLPPTNFVVEDGQGRFWVTVSTRLMPRALGYRRECNDGFIVMVDGRGARIVADGLGYTNEVALHPNGRWLYSIQEEGSTVTLLDHAGETGRLTARQTISTLPEGFVGSNFCSAISVSADGKFLYAGNRLHDSIALFSIGSDGRLTYIEEQWTRGNYPRSFSFDPSGNFLYCCNQRSDNIAIFRVDRSTGRLDFTGNYAAVGNPSMITFVELPKL